MKLSEKYFKKMQPQCMECGGNFSNEEVKRYGEYCREEGRFYQAKDKVQREHVQGILNEMAKEDKLKITTT